MAGGHDESSWHGRRREGGRRGGAGGGRGSPTRPRGVLIRGGGALRPLQEKSTLAAMIYLSGMSALTFHC